MLKTPPKCRPENPLRPSCHSGRSRFWGIVLLIGLCLQAPCPAIGAWKKPAGKKKKSLAAEHPDRASATAVKALAKARTLRAKGKGEMALNELKKALQIDPSLAEAYLEAADLYVALGSLEKALETLNAGIPLAEQQGIDAQLLGNAYCSRARLRVQFGQPDLASGDLLKAIGVIPGDPSPHLTMAEIQAKRGQVDAAIASYKQAVRCDSSLVDAWWAMGELAINRKKLEVVQEACAGLERCDSQKAQSFKDLMKGAGIKYRPPKPGAAAPANPADDPYAVDDPYAMPGSPPSGPAPAQKPVPKPAAPQIPKQASSPSTVPIPTSAPGSRPASVPSLKQPSKPISTSTSAAPAAVIPSQARGSKPDTKGVASPQRPLSAPPRPSPAVALPKAQPRVPVADPAAGELLPIPPSTRPLTPPPTPQTVPQPEPAPSTPAPQPEPAPPVPQAAPQDPETPVPADPGESDSGFPEPPSSGVSTDDPEASPLPILPEDEPPPAAPAGNAPVQPASEMPTRPIGSSGEDAPDAAPPTPEPQPGDIPSTVQGEDPLSTMINEEADHLLGTLLTGDEATKPEARSALASMGDKALPKLQGALVHPDPRLRIEALDILGSMGETGKSALPAIQNALNDADPEVRTKANQILSTLGQ